MKRIIRHCFSRAKYLETYICISNINAIVCDHESDIYNKQTLQ